MAWQGRDNAGSIVELDAVTQTGDARPATFRVAALPVFTLDGAEDVILSDAGGRAYLLSHEAPEPTPLDPAEANSLGMFFEASQDSSWHTLPELRHLIYGAELPLTGL